MRYTEYHSGKAVIRDKSLLGEAMEKLAAYEDQEQKRMSTEEFYEKITTLPNKNL